MELPQTGHLKAVWPDFWDAFLRSGRPRGPRKAFKNAGGEAPHLFERVQIGTPQIGPRRAGIRSAWSVEVLGPGGRGWTTSATLRVSGRGCSVIDFGILCYAVVLPGRKSTFHAGFWPDRCRESIEIGPPAGLRPAGGPMSVLSW
jgi:hypothetical protein